MADSPAGTGIIVDTGISLPTAPIGTTANNPKQLRIAAV